MAAIMQRRLLTLTLFAITAEVCAQEAAFVVEGTLEAALGQPMVQVRLVDGRRVLTGRSSELERLLGQEDEVVRSFPAFLDTGAGSFVISRATAQRFGVEAMPDAVYHEVGLHGEVQMGVSRPYSVALAGSDGGGARVEFATIEREARLLLNRSAEAPLLQQLGAGVDVVGMPAIQRLVVEIVPTAPKAQVEIEDLHELLQPPLVRLHEARPRVAPRDFVVPLEYMDFNRRRHPQNAGPLPALAANPVITGITVDHDGRSMAGEWLLDTGAASSLISSAHAQRLGLLDEAGKPAREPDFRLTVTGISGTPREHPGFVVDLVRVPADRDRAIEYRRVHVIVRDVLVRLDDGRDVTLDGVFGMNLLLASATGLHDGVPDKVADAPFTRVWIDGRGRRMILERR